MTFDPLRFACFTLTHGAFHYFISLSCALCSVLSLSFTVSSRQVPAHASDACIGTNGTGCEK
jgi:hypothetical protein